MLKVGVFGAGSWGKIHIEQWKLVPGIELVGFYDPDDDNALFASKQYNVKRYDDADELINSADIVDIVTPTSAHFNIAKKCLLSQKHIFIEKPLAYSLDEAAELVNLVKEANVKCQVGHTERYNPAFLALGSRSLQPMLIEAQRLVQFPNRVCETSVIMDLMVHDIDIVMHLVKSPVRRISASGVAVISELPDIASARIEFDNGCVANLTSSRVSLKQVQKMRLFQREAYIGVNFLDKKTEVISLRPLGEEGGVKNFPLEMPDGERKIITVDMPGVTMSNAVNLELSEFADAVLNDKPVRVTVYDGYQAMDVAEQILKKMSLHNEMHNV
jgi:predicted dehydrogenase